MSVRDSVIGTAFATVATTSLLVTTAGALTEGRTGHVAAQVTAVAVALVLGIGIGHLLVVGDLDRRVAELAMRLRRREPPPVLADPSLQPLDTALRVLVDEQNARISEAGRRADFAWEVLDTSPFAIALLDGEGRIDWVNRTFRTMFRLRGEPVGRRPIEVVLAAEIHEVVEEAIEHQRRAARSFITEKQDLFAFASPMSGDRTVLRVEDVTNLREAERARTDFVANVSHELRTPVAAVLGYLDLVLADRDRIPEDLVPLVETVDRNARRLRDLFEDLLKLHRIEVRRRELPLQQHPLRALLEEATGAARDKAAIRHQTLELDCPADLTALVNPEALSAMVGNLASNASAYTPEGGHVRVVALSDDKGVRVEVSDDGIGIAERHHERIFERFYRVDEARSRKVGGTGLGLAIVKHYALACRCTVTLQSEEGKGSTFVLHLPVR